jgi:hypothetical protein
MTWQALAAQVVPQALAELVTAALAILEVLARTAALAILEVLARTAALAILEVLARTAALAVLVTAMAA